MKHLNESMNHFFANWGLLKQSSLLLLLAMSIEVQAQKRDLSVSVKIPVQVEFQKAVITYGRDEIQKNTARFRR